VSASSENVKMTRDQSKKETRNNNAAKNSKITNACTTLGHLEKKNGAPSGKVES